MQLAINPALDLNYIDRVYGDDHQIISMIFNAFLTDCLPRWYDLKQLIENENKKEAASVVHGLKPSFAMTGLSDLKKKVEALEQLILNDGGKENQTALYTEINQEMAHLIPILQEEAIRLEKMA